MKHNIATLISYSSSDFPFLKHCLFEAKKFSKKIIVTACDHLFNGEEENIKHLLSSFSRFDFATFIIYPFIPDLIPSRIYKKNPPPYLWHNLARLSGFCHLDNSVDYVLFLDVDEIVDGARFKNWLDCREYLSFDALRPANYWYFRSPHFQATTFEDTAVLAKKKSISYKSLLHPLERDAIFEGAKGNKARGVLDQGGNPLIHHYSWVRTKNQMLKKVSTWGHKNDRNWKDLVEKEFSKDFTFKDFVHGYDFIKVNPFATIDLDETPLGVYENESKTIFLKNSDVINMLKKRSLKDRLYCSLNGFFK